MNFLVNKILDDGSVSYGLTGSGYVVLIIVCVLLMTIGCFARDNNSKLNVKPVSYTHLASWEKGLTGVAEGNITADEYMEKLDGFVSRRTRAVMALRNQAGLIGLFNETAKNYK